MGNRHYQPVHFCVAETNVHRPEAKKVYERELAHREAKRALSTEDQAGLLAEYLEREGGKVYERELARLEARRAKRQ